MRIEQKITTNHISQKCQVRQKARKTQGNLGKFGSYTDYMNSTFSVETSTRGSFCLYGNYHLCGPGTKCQLGAMGQLLISKTSSQENEINAEQGDNRDILVPTRHFCVYHFCLLPQSSKISPLYFHLPNLCEFLF